MSWRNYDVEEQKMLFIADWMRDEMTVADLCRSYGISRKTGYKLIGGYLKNGQLAFEEKSRARHNISNKTPEILIERLLVLKNKFPYFGPEKIRDWLIRNEPANKWPATSTIGEIFKQHGLVKKRKYRRKVDPYTQPFEECKKPNHVWSADFKGQFKLGNKRYCYPLTISDNYSRFLLACDGMYRPTLKEAQKSFEKAFYLYGLPEVIRTDNGLPFAGSGANGLSKLSIWWLKLGILPERIEPGCPEQNGRHERMHRTLKEATTKPSKNNLAQQQKRFNEFIQEYNEERSHEALDKKCPADIYVSSKRVLPSRIPEVCYPNDFEIRFVRSNGEIKWGGKKYFISELLYGEPIGIEQLENDQLAIFFSKLKLGTLNLKEGKLSRS